MEIDRIQTLSRYLDTIEVNLNKRAIVLDEPLNINDIKSPYTLIGVDLENQTYIIMRGYKTKSLINRYLKKRGVLKLFFIINSKNLDFYQYKLEEEYVSTIYCI